MATNTRTPACVVFDIGGVLLDWDPRYLYRSLIDDEREIERFLREVCTPEWNARQDAGRPWAEAVAELTAVFPDQAELIRAYDERWEETVGGPLHETVAILEELRAKGVPTYALTNFSAEKWALVVKRFDFLRAFDGAVVSGEERVMKPDHAIYRTLLTRYGLDAGATFYVDDVSSNVLGAREVGIDAEVFMDAEGFRADLESRGVL